MNTFKEISETTGEKFDKVIADGNKNVFLYRTSRG